MLIRIHSPDKTIGINSRVWEPYDLIYVGRYDFTSQRSNGTSSLYMVAGDIMGLLAAAAAAAVVIEDVDNDLLLLSGRSRAANSSDSGDDERWLNEDRSGDTQRMTPAPPLTLAVAAAETDGTTRQAMAM